jgi:hypothetical protein
VGGCCFLGAAAIRVNAAEPSISPAVAAAPFASPLRLRSGGGDVDGSSRAAAQNTCMLIVIITASWYVRVYGAFCRRRYMSCVLYKKRTQSDNC